MRRDAAAPTAHRARAAPARTARAFDRRLPGPPRATANQPGRASGGPTRSGCLCRELTAGLGVARWRQSRHLHPLLGGSQKPLESHRRRYLPHAPKHLLRVLRLAGRAQGFGERQPGCDIQVWDAHRGAVDPVALFHQCLRAEEDVLPEGLRALDVEPAVTLHVKRITAWRGRGHEHLARETLSDRVIVEAELLRVAARRAAE